MTSWQEQYKKTLVPTQVTIALVVLALGFWSRSIGGALVFLVAMQGCAVIGALWGARLKRKVDRAA